VTEEQAVRITRRGDRVWVARADDPADAVWFTVEEWARFLGTVRLFDLDPEHLPREQG
jgi:hypothetical protein